MKVGGRKKSNIVRGSITPDVVCKFVWVQKNVCKLCGGSGTEKHRLYNCSGWTKATAPDGGAKEDGCCRL